MLKRIVALVGIILIGTAAASAQHKFEASGFAGWSFDDGVSGTNVLAPDGRNYNRIDPKDGFVWGASGSYLIGENMGVGFMYSRQSSNLVLGGNLGSPDRDLGTMHISNYHGTLEYNFGEDGHPIRPFVYAGFGATNFGSTDFTSNVGNGTIQGHSKFSTQWGGGVKYFVNPKVAIRGAASWIPTYIKSDSTGYWCDPFWGCYLVGDPQYSNQFQLTGGVSFRF